MQPNTVHQMLVISMDLQEPTESIQGPRAVNNIHLGTFKNEQHPSRDPPANNSIHLGTSSNSHHAPKD